MTLSWVHSISQYQNAQETTQHYKLAPLFKAEAPGMKRRAEEWTVVTCHVARPHCHDTVLRFAVKLQVCTRLNSYHIT